MENIINNDFLKKDQEWFYKDENTIFTDELITDICEQLEEERLDNALFIAQQYK